MGFGDKIWSRTRFKARRPWLQTKKLPSPGPTAARAEMKTLRSCIVSDRGSMSGVY